ncbi:MAG TPA: membrane protein insertase YidC [Steroidobacteraceae bacterium]|jgi:YidC/Oxa1 family membrane protein insertase|nr:membrane protein insertase YidC [Steroidobacteraceae bacterium]
MNNNPRLYLWIALAVVLWMNYTTWQRDYPPLPAAATAAQSQTAPSKQQSSLANSIPQAEQSTTSGTPPAAAAPTSPPPAAAAAGIPAAEPAASANAPLIHVHTDVYDMDISTSGGTLEQVHLLKYAEIKGQAPRVQLENDASPQTVYLLQSGLTGSGDSPYPNHTALFTTPRQSYDMDGSQKLSVPLSWSSDGVTVTKTFVFTKGSYGIGLDYTIRNQGSAPWQARPYAQVYRYDPRTKSSYFNPNSYAYHGPAIWDGNKYERLDPSKADNQNFSLTVTNGWIAATQNDFVSAVVLPKSVPYHVTSKASGSEYLVAAVGPQQTVSPGATAMIHQTLFVGPMLHSQLEKIEPSLKYVVGYGYLTIVAGPLFWLLSKVHALTGNWGVAIVLVTFLLKLALYPLSEASGRSVAKMKVLGPRIKNIQETYKDDKEKLGRAMMEIYKREKVNPVSGCLPMVVQLPVFIAFYWVLLYSAEMRQAPFAFWIQDLSARDPYFILPGIMAIAMFVQYKINPTVADPAQAKVMMVMPIAMSAMFAFFPAGLVLYYLTNTLLGVAQQWNINRRVGARIASQHA